MWEIINGSITNGNLTIGNLAICTVFSLAFGFAASGIYMFRNQYSKGLAVTLIFIPATVQIIVMFMFTRGNIGLGIAIMGAFSLVRFRSFPGKARDIGTVFFVMAIGIVLGMGYIFYAFISLLLIGGVSMLMTFSRLGQREVETRSLRITIPENLDYDGLFDEVFVKYTQNVELVRVRTTNMGSLYELTYSVRLKSPSVPKEFIDELRCRNGNLNIQISREQRRGEEL